MKNFIVPFKTVKKNLGQTAINAVVRGAGGVAGTFVQNKLGPKLPATLQKHKGAIAILMGTAIDAFAEQPQLKALGQGIAVSGMMQEAIEFAGTDLKPQISLQGIDDIDSINEIDYINSINEIDDIDSINEIDDIDSINIDEPDWDALAREAENDASVKGLLDDSEEISEDMNGAEDDNNTASLLS